MNLFFEVTLKWQRSRHANEAWLRSLQLPATRVWVIASADLDDVAIAVRHDVEVRHFLCSVV
jgi:hypothetical protein